MGKIVVHEDSFKALTDMRTKQFFIVKLHTTAPFMAILAATNARLDRVLGVLQDKPDINEFGRVMIFGRTEAVVDGSAGPGAIAPGDHLMVNDSGVALIKANAIVDSNQIAFAYQAASIAGAVIDVFFYGSVGPFRTYLAS